MGSRGYQERTRPETRKCAECGKEFTTTRCGVYCSPECKRRVQNRRNYAARKAKK